MHPGPKLPVEFSRLGFAEFTPNFLPTVFSKFLFSFAFELQFIFFGISERITCFPLKLTEEMEFSGIALLNNAPCFNSVTFSRLLIEFEIVLVFNRTGAPRFKGCFATTFVPKFNGSEISSPNTANLL